MKATSALTRLLFLVYSVSCSPCGRLESLNITGGVEFSNGSVIHGGLEYVSGAWYDLEEDGALIRLGCPCIGRVCLWKCCGEGEAFSNKTCAATDHAAANPFSPPIFRGKEPLDVAAHSSFFFMHSRLCDERYLVDTSSPTERIFIQQVMWL
ncbi:unnamed protein product, partial [Iphiclides podalirius]